MNKLIVPAAFLFTVVVLVLQSSKWQHRYKAEHARLEAYARADWTTNSNTFALQGKSNHFDVKFWTNKTAQGVRTVDEWCNYSYGQGVTNGVIAAVSMITDLLNRVSSGENPTLEGLTNAIFGSISNAMSQDKYRYLNSKP